MKKLTILCPRCWKRVAVLKRGGVASHRQPKSMGGGECDRSGNSSSGTTAAWVLRENAKLGN